MRTHGASAGLGIVSPEGHHQDHNAIHVSKVDCPRQGAMDVEVQQHPGCHQDEGMVDAPNATTGFQ